MKYMWHSTDINNLRNIMEQGLLLLNAERVIYLAETENDALRFSMFRGYGVTVTLKVKIYKKDEDKLFETFDHSYEYFKCKAFGYSDNIPASNIIPYKYYNTLAIIDELRNKSKEKS